jgi:hypothetical protein
MIHVERAVRPVRGEESTKCGMREELYAHIAAIYEEERRRTGGEQAAIDAARRRFGEPDALTAELQESVPRIERFFSRIDATIQRRRGESTLRHALRMILTCLLCYTALAVVTLTATRFLPVAGVGPSVRSLTAHSALGLRVVVAFGAWFIVHVGVFTLIGYAMRSQVEAGLLKPRTLFAAAGFCVLSALTVLLSSWAFLLSLPIDPAAAFELLPRWLIMAGLTPLGFAVLSRIAAIEAARSRPWTSLEIDD